MHLSFPPTETKNWSSPENLTLVICDECPKYSLWTYFFIGAGYLNKFILPKSSPVAKANLLLLRQTVFTSVPSLPGKIPYEGQPKVQV